MAKRGRGVAKRGRGAGNRGARGSGNRGRGTGNRVNPEEVPKKSVNKEQIIFRPLIPQPPQPPAPQVPRETRAGSVITVHRSLDGTTRVEHSSTGNPEHKFEPKYGGFDGSTIVVSNIGQPLSVCAQRKIGETEVCRVRSIHGDEMAPNGTTLFFHVEWERFGEDEQTQRTWEPLCHLNCLEMIAEYYRKKKDNRMADIMEVYKNMQPTSLRMHLRDASFAFNKRAEMLHNKWMCRAFLHESVEKKDMDDRLFYLNRKLFEIEQLHQLQQLHGAAKCYEIVNSRDGFLPSLPYGNQPDLKKYIQVGNSRDVPVPQPPSPNGTQPRLVDLYPRSEEVPTCQIYEWKNDALCLSGPLCPLHPLQPSKRASFRAMIIRSLYGDWGVHATSLSGVEEGTNLIRVQGMIVDKLVVDNYIKHEACQILAMVNFIPLKDGLFLDRRQHFDYSRFIQQSCVPNTEFHIEGEGKNQKVFIRTIKPIVHFERLRLDHLPAVKEGHERPRSNADYVECLCRAPTCRRVLWIDDSR